MATDETMPVDTLASVTVKDESDDVEAYFGRAGGSYDDETGILSLVYTPYDEEFEDDGFTEVYQQTTVKFVELEKLLDTLVGIVRYAGTDKPSDRDYWRDIIAQNRGTL